MSLKLKVEGCLLTRLERVKEGREEKKGRKEGRREKEGILLRSLYQVPFVEKLNQKTGCSVACGEPFGRPKDARFLEHLFYSGPAQTGRYKTAQRGGFGSDHCRTFSS